MNLVPQRSGTLGNISYILFPLSCRTNARLGKRRSLNASRFFCWYPEPRGDAFYGSLLLPKWIISIDCKALLINVSLLQTLRHMKQINETFTLISLSLDETFVFRLTVQFVWHVTISLIVTCVERRRGFVGPLRRFRSKLMFLWSIMRNEGNQLFFISVIWENNEWKLFMFGLFLIWIIPTFSSVRAGVCWTLASPAAASVRQDETEQKDQMTDQYISDVSWLLSYMDVASAWTISCFHCFYAL